MNPRHFRFLGPLAAALFLALASCSSPFGSADSTLGPAAFQVRLGVGSAAASWRSVLGARGFRFEWSADPAYPAEATKATELSGTSATVDGLEPGVTYHFRVQAHLNNGPTAWSEAAAKPSGWTWARPGEALPDVEYQQTIIVQLDGQTYQKPITYTAAQTQYDTLRYDASGLTWVTLVRTSTTGRGAAPLVVETVLAERPGSWTTRWESFSLTDGGAFSPEFSGDRTSFTLGGQTWSLVK